MLPPSETFASVQTRVIRWHGPLGKPTQEGLLASYPSFRLYAHRFAKKESIANFPNSRWQALNNLPELRVIFKELNNGVWYQIAYKSAGPALQVGGKPNEMPLRSIANLIANGNVGLVLSEELSENPNEHIDKKYREGTLVTITHKQEGVLHARLGAGVLFGPLAPHEVLVYEATELLVQEMRECEMHEYPDIDPSEENEAEVVKSLRAKIKDLVSQAITAFPGLADAVLLMMGEGGRPQDMWVLVTSWFGHVLQGVKLGKEQMWCLD